MNEAYNVAYNFNYPIITFLVDWDCYSIDLRNGNILEFWSKQAFLSYVRRNLRGCLITLITAGNEVQLTQNTIN